MAQATFRGGGRLPFKSGKVLLVHFADSNREEFFPRRALTQGVLTLLSSSASRAELFRNALQK